MSITNKLEELRVSLPQASHITPQTLLYWEKRCARQGFSPSEIIWMASRANSIGGSEAGAIAAHYVGYAVDSDIDDAFKTADEILKEKLFIGSTFRTTYAERGQKVEPVILDIFERKFKLDAASVDHEAMEACKNHATSAYSKGNTDRVYKTEYGRLLLDAKSTNSKSEIVPFSHIAQLNQYAEIGRSNGIKFEKAATAQLICDEAVFKWLIKLHENRNLDDTSRAEYHQFTQSIIEDRLPFITFRVREIPIYADLGKQLIELNERFFNEYVNRGIRSVKNHEATALTDDEKADLDRYSEYLYQAHIQSKAIKTNIEAANKLISQKLMSIDGVPELPKGVINIKRISTFDNDLALDALQVAGYDISLLEKTTEKINVEKLVKSYIQLGGVLDDDHYVKEIKTEDIKKAIHDTGLNPLDFEKEISYTTSLSGKNEYKDKIISDQIEISSQLNDLVNHQIQIEKDNEINKKKISFSLNQIEL